MRDKLIELLSENFVDFCHVVMIAGNCKISAVTLEADKFADHLIASGVTVGDVADNNVVNIPANERLPVKLTRVDFAKCEGCHWQYAPDGQTDCWVCEDNDHYVEGE